MLAESIAKLLSDGQSTKRKGAFVGGVGRAHDGAGWNGACSIHEWSGRFQSRAARYKMTSTCGHVMSLDFASKYNNWESVDPVQLFDAQVVKKEATAKLKMPAFLESEAKNVDALVLWLDCDKEGENICFEVMHAVASVMRVDFDGLTNVWRAHFSAITEKDIKAAMKNLSA
jgi:DNA topoisomerase-3